MKRSLTRRLESIATEVGVGRKKSGVGGEGLFLGALNALQSNAPDGNKELERKMANRMRLIMLGAIKSLDCLRKDDVCECASQIVDRIKQRRLGVETSSRAAATTTSNTKGAVYNLNHHHVASSTTNWGSERSRGAKRRFESGGTVGGSDVKKQKGSSSTTSTSYSPMPAWAARLTSVGDHIAAKVASHNLYILTQVEACNRDGTYIVRDADPLVGHRTYTLRRSALITLPKGNESSGGCFMVGRKVMALYPRTTSFYPATVSRPASWWDSKGMEITEVQFDDDENEFRLFNLYPFFVNALNDVMTPDHVQCLKIPSEQPIIIPDFAVQEIYDSLKHKRGAWESRKSWHICMTKADFKFRISYFDDEKSMHYGSPFVTSDTYTVKIMLHGDCVGHDGYVIDFVFMKKSARAICKHLDGKFVYAERSEIFTREAMDDGMYNISFSHSHGGSLGSFTFIPSDECAILPLKRIDSYHLAMYFFTELVKILQIKFLHMRKVDEVKVTIESSSGWSQTFTANVPERNADLATLDY